MTPTVVAKLATAYNGSPNRQSLSTKERAYTKGNPNVIVRQNNFYHKGGSEEYSSSEEEKHGKAKNLAIYAAGMIGVSI